MTDSGQMVQVAENLFEWIRSIRRTIHHYPELGFGEQKTARLVEDRLTELGIGYRAGIAGTGIVATLGADSGSGGHVLLRADMDGLPIQEKTGLPFGSAHDGIMHACGHDGHTAMLLGAAALLKERDLQGRVDFLFQPAEESGGGAAKMISEGVLDGVQAAFAGHIDTHYKTGVITVDEGVICAWADPFTIRIHGRGGHAARPQEAADAVVAAASLVTTLQTLVSRETNPNHSAVVTIGRVQAGVAHNVIAADAVLEGTVRSTEPDSRFRTIEGIERIIRGIATVHGVETTIDFNDSLPAVVNSPAAVQAARRAALAVAGESNVVSQGPPSLGGEDFSFYQQQVEGCLVRFGAALGPEVGPAHSDTFDFDEEVFSTGAAWLAAAALTWLEKT